MHQLKLKLLVLQLTSPREAPRQPGTAEVTTSL